MTDSAEPKGDDHHDVDPKKWTRHGIVIVIVCSVILIASLPVLGWFIYYRSTHSITYDAYVRTYLVNVSSMEVSGHLDVMNVQEEDVVTSGQWLARIDPRPYERKVEVARAELEVAIASLAEAKTALELVEKQVPREIAIAENDLGVAQVTLTEARERLELTTRDVTEQISAARSAIESASARHVMAEEDYVRFSNLYQQESVALRRLEEATSTFKTTRASLQIAEANFAQAEAARKRVAIDEGRKSAAADRVSAAKETVELARLGTLRIEEASRNVEVLSREVDAARRRLELAQTNLGYTRIVAPFDGMIAKQYRFLGNYAEKGAPIFTMFVPDLLFVVANLEETRLEGVHPGNHVRLDVEAFWEPFKGRVVTVGSATAANFSLVPRDISSGEFTWVVQRVPIRIWIERDERWNQLKPGLSVTVSIEHGPGDPEWARKVFEEELRLETRTGIVD
ncbi:Multidrug resistance protein MdtN [Planctomycetes bacterium Pan216]|uniref:Multidrug resistance protein MdtN n=1 Tax=Kolteria novifilia TaxID=2527975 RepID=A0A518B5Q1_9BACT|nr:Multidrug resistance protein MdtN [Planctomycetes bacterium Pan216]